jgi:DNA repair protein RadC
MHNTTPTLYVRDPAGEYVSADAQTLLEAALAQLKSQFRKPVHSEPVMSPERAANLIRLQIGADVCEREHFVVVFANTRNEVIAVETLFQGTIDGAAVYPREVVKAALKHNASAVVLGHNHPSGNANPSSADERITQTLLRALQLIDVRVLDHIIVTPETHVSFGERGLL